MEHQKTTQPDSIHALMDWAKCNMSIPRPMAEQLVFLCEVYLGYVGSVKNETKTSLLTRHDIGGRLKTGLKNWLLEYPGAYTILELDAERFVRLRNVGMETFNELIEVLYVAGYDTFARRLKAQLAR